ncbi:MAG: fumarylacetoacetate hydrolase family protein, partial [Brachybacterium paraconglomeratum]|nr:fumarylacetoacetate hydrolase family protein [Brachybacterium paraconglomeratum]
VSLGAELAVVIKRMAKDLAREQVADHVLGYTCANDLTARDSQRAEDQWFRAKAFDTSCPIGPWIETDLDPAAGLAISSRVDDETAQSGSTADMVRGVPELIAEISSVVTLLPGDIVLTGTPAGVRTVEPGARIDVEIEGIGTLSNPLVRR